MNWLRNFVPPRLRELVGAQREPTEDLWRKCPKCGGMIFHRDYENRLRVCPHCDHHMRLTVEQRLAMLFDDGAHAPIELVLPASDPLRFRDRRRYSDRLKEAHGRSGAEEALLVAHGRLAGTALVVAAQNYAFMGGTMGRAMGDGLLAAARLAVIQESPLVVVTASAGARLQEGSLGLLQMARVTLAAEEVRNAGQPLVLVLSDPTLGSVAASLAMLGDVVMAEPGASVALAARGPMASPRADSRAEELLAGGLVDMVVHRHRLRATLGQVVSLLRNPGPSAEVVTLPHVELLLAMKGDGKTAPTAKRPPESEKKDGAPD